MPTLNAGFAQTRENKISESDKALIEEFIRTVGVTKLQPAGVDGNEASRGTRERIAAARREFRKNRKNKS